MLVICSIIPERALFMAISAVSENIASPVFTPPSVISFSCSFFVFTSSFDISDAWLGPMAGITVIIDELITALVIPLMIVFLSISVIILFICLGMFVFVLMFFMMLLSPYMPLSSGSSG